MKKTLSVPKHIGFILDGNGRWATKKHLPRLHGHKAGIDAVKKTLENAKKYGVEIISLYAFSTENWSRPKEEIDGIFKLLENFLENYKNEFIENGMRLRTMGDISKLPKTLVKKIEELSEKTRNNSTLVVNIGLNYGGRDELVRAVNELIKSGSKKITISDIQKNLYTHDLPDPDLIVRTSGEQRLSNFMLFQSSYSELYFPKVKWPDFNERWFLKTLKAFKKRHRRYGGIVAKKS